MLIENNISIAHYKGYQHILNEIRKIHTALKEERDKKLKIFVEALEQDPIEAMATKKEECDVVLVKENYFPYLIRLDYAISKIPKLTKAYKNESEAKKAGELEALFKMQQVIFNTKVIAADDILPALKFLADTIYYPLLKDHILKHHHLEKMEKMYNPMDDLKNADSLYTRYGDFQEYLTDIKCLENYLIDINTGLELDKK